MKKLEPKINPTYEDFYEFLGTTPKTQAFWSKPSLDTSASTLEIIPKLDSGLLHQIGTSSITLNGHRTLMVGQYMHEQLNSVILKMIQQDCSHETTTICVESVEGEDGLTHKTQFLKCSRCGKIITDKITNTTI